MLLDFTWWVNGKDPLGEALFGGGFLGMDNVGPFDRSAPLPEGQMLEQADGTGWMALYCLSMLEIALILAAEDPSYEDVAVKFFGHFTLIARAINDRGLWDGPRGRPGRRRRRERPPVLRGPGQGRPRGAPAARPRAARLGLQALYGIALGARTSRTLLESDPQKAAGPLDYVLSLSEAGLAEMRALIFSSARSPWSRRG